MMTQDTAMPIVDRVSEALTAVLDPEIGINIVDLGLVYGVRMEDDVAILDLTLTSAACPLTDVIEGQIFAVLDGLVPDYSINWVWMPPWSPARMNAEGREQARAIGLAI
jgi:metal-sulfur cluster biosynthetic enzyme